MNWYRTHARELPWRGVTDPYRTWVSEVMLQQTRVAAVIEHYNNFLRRFPTIVALALATEAEVLAAWSGLGYYRRARMLHKAAQFIVEERGGSLPHTAVELRTLPGIGEYTCAAIASIAFGESIAVVDGNVERVLLRLTGRAEEATAASRAFVQQQAAALVPRRRIDHSLNAAGDHNQAMMELGATICLPRAPLCLQLPRLQLCARRAASISPPPAHAQRSQPAAYLLHLRKRGTITEVLLERRCRRRQPDGWNVRASAAAASTPFRGASPCFACATPSRTPTTTCRSSPHADRNDRGLRRAVPAARADLQWVRTSRLLSLPSRASRARCSSASMSWPFAPFACRSPKKHQPKAALPHASAARLEDIALPAGAHP